MLLDSTFRKVIPSLLGVAFLVFVAIACKQEVDVFADTKEIPVIYGLLDAKADTNFVRITKAVVTDDNAAQLMQHPEQLCYDHKLDVWLVEYENNRLKRTIPLDTLSSKLYFTDTKLGKNTKQSHYSYELKIVVDDDTITSKADLVGDNAFSIGSPNFNFSLTYFGMLRSFRFAPAQNACFYDVTVMFRYKERRLPSEDTVVAEYRFMYDRHYSEQLDYTLSDGYYTVRYRPEYFWSGLAEFLGDDTLNDNVIRYITDDPIEVLVEAGGWELLNYYLVNYDPQYSGSYAAPDLSCVGHGAAGLFSSKAKAVSIGRLSGTTVPELINRGWGFKYIGGVIKDEGTID